MKLKIAVAARSDILDIRQAERYLQAINNQIRALIERPTPGKTCDDVRPGLHRVGIGRHVIFFRITKAAVIVVRVLHDQMLPRLHLESLVASGTCESTSS